ncbi:MAG: hypothetical protein ACI965_000520 [Paraglaciecola sp.]|jgi:membrane protein implicated in regulation of membrane protease activity
MSVPGMIATLRILMALYVFQLLPINYAVAGITLLGVGLIVAEAMVPSFGIFGIGSIVVFVISSAGFIFLSIGMLLKNRQRKPVSRIENLLGEVAEVETLYGHQPMVRLQGELWWVKGDTLKVVVPQKSIIQVEDFLAANRQLSQITLRSVLEPHELDEMLAERDQLNAHIQSILDRQTDAWGIKVSNVEIKHVDLDEGMIRAIAQQAEVERTRRAKVILALGELEAAKKLLNAANILAKQPQALQLQYLQTFTKIAGDKSNTFIFPLQMDLFGKLKKWLPDNEAWAEVSLRDCSDPVPLE